MAPCAGTLLLPLLLIQGIRGSRGQCANASELSARLDTLLAEYDRGTPPPPPLPVELTLELRHASVDDRAGAVRVLADLRMSWVDSRISWNASEWGCESTAVPAERLWRPDVMLLSAVVRSGEAALAARLAADGRLVWPTRLDLAAPLDMDLERWPHDEQTVTFTFGSKSLGVDEIELQLSKDQNSMVFEAGAWNLTSVLGVRSREEEGGAPRWLVSWEVGLRRRAGAHARAAAAALLAAALLLLAAALLPPADRASLCAAASFTAALWLVSCVSRLPSSSTSPLVVRAAGALCGCGAAAAAAAALVRRVAAARAPPPAALCALLSAASTLCRLTPHQEGDVSESGAGSGAWRAAALLLDRALLAALALALLVIGGCAATALSG